MEAFVLEYDAHGCRWRKAATLSAICRLGEEENMRHSSAASPADRVQSAVTSWGAIWLGTTGGDVTLTRTAGFLRARIPQAHRPNAAIAVLSVVVSAGRLCASRRLYDRLAGEMLRNSGIFAEA